jgi:multidrug efflux pump subunit AcrA (membrane-fusion protein)
MTAGGLAVMLAACSQENHYVAPPPPQVTVALPVSETVTRYLEATGNTAAVNSANLVARVQGFIQKIHYQDGDVVKQGTTLFTIEPETYKLKDGHDNTGRSPTFFAQEERS